MQAEGFGLPDGWDQRPESVKMACEALSSLYDGIGDAHLIQMVTANLHVNPEVIAANEALARDEIFDWHAILAKADAEHMARLKAAAPAVAEPAQPPEPAPAVAEETKEPEEPEELPLPEQTEPVQESRARGFSHFLPSKLGWFSSFQTRARGFPSKNSLLPCLEDTGIAKALSLFPQLVLPETVRETITTTPLDTLLKVHAYAQNRCLSS